MWASINVSSIVLCPDPLLLAPWTLYTSARARRTHVSYADIRNNPANDEHLRRLAGTELRLAELTYLAFTVIAPFLGAILLRSVSKLLSMDVVSTFSTSLFVMATGIRPWRHLIDLLRQRAEALHDVVHVPSEESVRSRVETIEEHLRDIQSVLQDRSGETDMLEAANASLELARKELRKVEKNAEATRIANDARLKALEMAVEALQNTPVHPPLHTLAPIHNGTTVAFTIPQSLADIVIRPFDRLSAFASPPKRRYGNMRNEKTPLTRAEIVEVDDDDDDAGFGESEYEEDRKAPSTKGSGKRVSFAVIERDQDQQPEDMPFFVWVIERLTWIALYPFRWIRALATLFLSIPLE
ncbi:hypothetical protein FRB98_005687 [Tulasnella sp. 332]|nr:hypothetical protein FRB98_005687 [Tulasnella sp. 332]